MKLKTYIKRLILGLIKKSGYELKGIKKQVRYNDFDAIINFLLKDKKKHVYFDVGANKGQSIERFKKINLYETFRELPRHQKNSFYQNQIMLNVMFNMNS